MNIFVFVCRVELIDSRRVAFVFLISFGFDSIFAFRSSYWFEVLDRCRFADQRIHPILFTIKLIQIQTLINVWFESTFRSFPNFQTNLVVSALPVAWFLKIVQNLNQLFLQLIVRQVFCLKHAYQLLFRVIVQLSYSIITTRRKSEYTIPSFLSLLPNAKNS